MRRPPHRRSSRVRAALRRETSMFRYALMRGVSAGAMTLVLLSPIMAQVALPPIDIDAEKAKRSADDLSTPLGAATVSEEKLATERPAYSDATQLLSGTPGVSFYEGGGVSRLPALRGLADDRIKILLGGQEVSSACANHMNPPLSYIDPNNVGRIQVLSGVTPVSKGGDSIAGTIVVEPKPPIFAGQAAPGRQSLLPWNGPSLLTSGSISTFYRSTNSSVSVSGTANAATDHFSLLYNGSYTRGSDYHMGGNGPKVLSTSFISENHSATLAYQNEGHLFTLRGGYQNIPFQAWPNVRMDMTGIAGRGSGNRSYSIDAGYIGTFEWGKIDANAYWRHTAHIMNFLYDKMPAAMPMFTAGTDFGYSIKAEIPLSQRDLLRIGNEFHGARLNDWWEPVLGASKGMMGPDTLWNINNGKRDRVGTFAEWEAKWTPQWTTLLGVRNDTVWMDTGLVQPYGWDQMIRLGPPTPLTNARDAALFNAVGHSRTDVNFDVTALVRYQPDEGSVYEAGYSRKTRSPNLYERYAWNYGYSSDMVGWFGDANGYVGNLDLKPEVAHTFNFTAAWRDAVGGNWEAKISPYFTYAENFIDADKVGQF
ncbi:MAG: TonB-dependent receptor, partial [Methylocystaceae bacterium]